jgi:hypothetical protein
MCRAFWLFEVLVGEVEIGIWLVIVVIVELYKSPWSARAL